MLMLFSPAKQFISIILSSKAHIKKQIREGVNQGKTFIENTFI